MGGGGSRLLASRGYGQRRPGYNARDGILGTRSWQPSPMMSDVSDDELGETDLSVEEKAAKVRAEIRRRRQRLADTGRLYRNLSLDDYNFDSDVDPISGDRYSDVLNASYRYNNNTNYTGGTTFGNKSRYFDDYPLRNAKGKYFSDEYVLFECLGLPTH